MSKKPKIRPNEVDESNVRHIVLSGLANGVELVEIADRLSPFHPPQYTFPGETLLELAADAVTHSGATREKPLQFGDIRERFLPELNLTKKQDHYKSKWAIRAAAMIHGGVDPGLDEELLHWYQDDYWQWALDAVVVYVRAAADYRDLDVGDITSALAKRHGISLDAAESEQPRRPSWLPVLEQ